VQLHITNVVAAIAIYLVLVSMLIVAGGALPTILFLVYAAICVYAVNGFITGAQSRRSDNAVEFAQSGATNAIGVQFGSFHHVYASKEAVNEAYRSALNSALKTKLGCSEMREVTFKDLDDDLNSPESRTFELATAPASARKTEFSLLCHFTRSSDVQGVRWWMLVTGMRDPNKVFWIYVLAPLSVPLTLFPYMRRQYDPLSELMTIYPGFFNGIDVLNRTREMQFVAFETLVEVLDAHGIDTSDLKQQKATIFNINVSGGKASFGSVVQGTMNRVAGAVGGAAHYE
jgi:hypothetical protein